MKPTSLASRIEAETGLRVLSHDDVDLLAGFFNRYRPEGLGVDRFLSGNGVEGLVRERIEKVFRATASSWTAGDLYFINRHFDPLDHETACILAKRHLQDISNIARGLGDVETSKSISELRFVLGPHSAAGEDVDVATMVYESLTYFLADFQPGWHELFLLKEALYSMANDYCLMAYILWPVVKTGDGDIGDMFDSYFELWRYGVTLTYHMGGVVAVDFSRA